MAEQDGKTDVTSLEQSKRKWVYGAVTLFLASGGLAAYLHFANPIPSECSSPSYRMNAFDHAEVIKHQEAFIEGMEETLWRNSVASPKQVQLFKETHENLNSEKAWYEECKPVRIRRTVRNSAVALAFASSALAGVNAFDIYRIKRKKVDVYSLVKSKDPADTRNYELE